MTEAADCFERAGLAWEALPTGAHRPALGIDGDTLNSSLSFQRAKCLFASAGDYDGSSRCSILERNADLRWSPSPFRRAVLRGSRFMWLHGESPLFVLRALLIAVLTFALGFYMFGFKHGSNETANPSSFWNALYLSCMTLTTVGYGDFCPDAGVSRFLAAGEGFTGIFLMAMFLIALQRRYVGR